MLIEGRVKAMNVMMDVVQGALHYIKHIGGILDILRMGTPLEGPCKTTQTAICYSAFVHYKC